MSQNEMHFDVAITGAGFSGTIVAVHLGVNPNTRVHQPQSAGSVF
jgi:choline dehydrogenase-like flavoprotein